MKQGIAACLLLVVIGAVMVEHTEATILLKTLLLSQLLKGKKAKAPLVPKVIATPAPVARVTGPMRPVYASPTPVPGHYESALATKTSLLNSAVDTASATATTVVGAKTAAAKTGVSALGTGKGLIGSAIDKFLSG